jgi:hypothetical protein
MKDVAGCLNKQAVAKDHWEFSGAPIPEPSRRQWLQTLAIALVITLAQFGILSLLIIKASR